MSTLNNAKHLMRDILDTEGFDNIIIIAENHEEGGIATSMHSKGISGKIRILAFKEWWKENQERYEKYCIEFLEKNGDRIISETIEEASDE